MTLRFGHKAVCETDKLSLSMRKHNPANLLEIAADFIVTERQ